MIALTDAEVIRVLVGIPTTLCMMAFTGKRTIKRWWASFDGLNETSRDTDSVARPPNRPPANVEAGQQAAADSGSTQQLAADGPQTITEP